MSNPRAAALFDDLIHADEPQSPQDSELHGLNMSPGYVQRVRGYVYDAVQKGGIPETRWTKNDLYVALSALNRSLVRREPLNLADSPEVLAHERAHAAQRRLGKDGQTDGHIDAGALLKHPEAMKAADNLAETGYDRSDPEERAAEIDAHLEEGPTVQPRSLIRLIFT